MQAGLNESQRAACGRFTSMDTLSDDADWPSNYFNYFTEIEEHFQRARGTGLFLLSPLDWALIENWKNAGVPLEAVLAGIDEAFTKWHAGKKPRRQVNSVAYCAQAVMRAAERAPARNAAQSQPADSPFPESDVQAHLAAAVSKLRARPEPVFREELATSLDHLIANLSEELRSMENLERRLTALEDKMMAAARAAQSEEDLYAMRESLDRELRPYRGKMSADQIVMLERRYLDTALLEHMQLPRFSLFYLR
jgi:hypothetical protein